MSRYTYVLFDADATLLDFKRSEYEAAMEVLTFFGMPATDEVIEKYSQINDMYWKMLEKGEVTRKNLTVFRWRDLCQYYKYNCDADAISEKYSEFLSEKSYLLDGAEEICKRLYGKCKLYLVTNGNKKVQKGRFNHSPIYKYFESCFISEDTGYEKPQKEFFDSVFSQIPEFDKSQAIIVGDSLSSDIAGGINAGIDTCWYNPHNIEPPKNMKITFIKTNLLQVEDAVIWGK